jgi:pyruvate/2-oxoglutarate dehydrogenase complex dihydrolipoamide dehydrogenase (E3) component
VAIVERGPFGGTCVNNGCIPTKTLVASANAAHLARRAADFGVDAGPVAVDMKRVKARKDQVSAASRDGLESWLSSLENVRIFRGHGRFTADDVIEVNGERLSAPLIFINTGGRPSVPRFCGDSAALYWTNLSMMEVDFLPEHLAVIGGSYIGLEFAQMFRRFGSRVTVVEKGPRLVQREDPDVSDAIRTILEDEGITILLNSDCIGIEAAGPGTLVHADTSEGHRDFHASQVLVAVGRIPNTDDLGLETTSIVRDERGYIKVDERLETSVPGVYALGDCNGRGAFTHTSYNDFEIVAANLLDGANRRVSERIDAYALYIDPPLGRCGLTEDQVRRSGRPARIATRPMTRVGRAVEKGESRGFMKILVDEQTQRILGASILGLSGDEAIHSVLTAMYAGQPYTMLQQAMFIHPTVSELIPTLLGSLRPLD